MTQAVRFAAQAMRPRFELSIVLSPQQELDQSWVHGPGPHRLHLPSSSSHRWRLFSWTCHRSPATQRTLDSAGKFWKILFRLAGCEDREHPDSSPPPSPPPHLLPWQSSVFYVRSPLSSTACHARSLYFLGIESENAYRYLYADSRQRCEHADYEPKLVERYSPEVQRIERQ